MTRRRSSRYHRDLMDGYYSAREAWERQAETVTLNYDTELAEYAASNPRPTFRAWLMHREKEMA